MSGRGAVLLNRLINWHVGLSGCVRSELDSEVLPCGAEENPEAPQGEGMWIFSSEGNHC